MGTRNLTVVVLGGKNVVAQYGQWDGYPPGVGKDVLDFARASLSSSAGLDAFRKQLAKIRFIDSEELLDLYEKVGVPRGQTMITMDQARSFASQNPQLDRDMAAQVLPFILAHRGAEIVLKDSYDFAADSLFCEWAYVLDLDAGTFEVFKGFNESPLPAGERFEKLTPAVVEKYYPVRLAAKWKLDDLPSDDEFIARFNSEDE